MGDRALRRAAESAGRALGSSKLGKDGGGPNTPRQYDTLEVRVSWTELAEACVDDIPINFTK
eukprot:10742905-Alexandrium_andersonii.AAC.1